MNKEDEFLKYLEDAQKYFYNREDGCSVGDFTCVYKWDALGKFAGEVIEKYKEGVG